MTSAVLAELEAQLTQIIGRRVSLRLESRLREELGLDSLGLIQLAVWVYERYGVNLGRIAEETGRPFEAVRDIVDVLPSS